MTVRLKRYAPWVLTAGIVLALYGLFWTLLRGQLEPVGEVTLAVGLAAIAAFVALDASRVWGALTGRTARQGGNAVVVTVAVIGILVLLNVLAARHHKRFDLTAEREFSLSKQSLQVLAGLKQPVAVTAYMTPRYFDRQQVEDLLKEYTYHTDKLHLEIVDPEQKPALARQAGVTRDGTVVFQVGDRRQEALGSDEQEFTSALVKVTRNEAKVVYFLTGHHERDPQDGEQAGYQQISEALKRDNYEIQSLNLAITPTVPTTASVVVIAAPTVTPTAEEFKAINAYVDRGGSLLVLGDPATDPSLDGLLARWGLNLRPDIVVDPASSFFGDIATPVVSRFPYHDITKDLGGLTTFFPACRSIGRLDPTPQGVQVSPLVQTSPESWGETDRTSQQVQLDPAKDTPGPLDLAVAATFDLPGATGADQAPTKRARLVLLGDADLVANDVLQSVQGNSGNADLFLNAVSWLAEEESLISIRPNALTQHMILLTPPQVRLVMYTSLLFLPGLVVVAGAWVWWRRR